MDAARPSRGLRARASAREATIRPAWRTRRPDAGQPTQLAAWLSCAGRWCLLAVRCASTGYNFEQELVELGSAPGALRDWTGPHYSYLLLIALDRGSEAMHLSMAL